MKAFVFPGQGAQFSGMGKDLYDASPQARARFEEANDILGFDIASIMFEGSDEELKQNQGDPTCHFPALGHPCRVFGRGVSTRHGRRPQLG